MSGLAAILEMSRDPDPKTRVQALERLCPCKLKADRREAWERIIEMTQDENRKVRSHAFHALGDGSPRAREREVVQAIQNMRGDPDPKLRRRVRKLLAHYRRTGNINAL